MPRPDDVTADLETVTDKAEVLTILRRSSEQQRTAFEQATAGDLDREVYSNGATARDALAIRLHLEIQL